MDAQQRINQLESKLKEQQARQFWAAKGGDSNAWNGLKDTILKSVTLTPNDEIDQAEFDKALEAIPGVHRHFGQEEQTTPNPSPVGGAWEAVSQARAAVSPRGR